MSSLTRQIRKNMRRLKGASQSSGRERLVACAIMRRGRMFSYGHRDHRSIRRQLGDEDIYNPSAGDIDGFVTSLDRFVDRHDAKYIGESAGQCRPMLRDLLSSDINWSAGR